MNEKNVLVLKKIYENSKTAVDAFGMIKKYSDSNEFNDFIDKQKYKYFYIAEDANMKLKEMQKLPDDMDILAKLGLVASLKWRKRKINNYAQILIDGCMGGVNEMIGEIRCSKYLDSDCLDLAHILIETEQETIANLQRFL